MNDKKKSSPIGADQILKADFAREPDILGRGILPAGGGMIIAGDTNVGKSLVRVEWTLLLALGLPIYDMETPEPQRIIVFQDENPNSSEQYRMRKLMQGLNIDGLPRPERIHYARRARGIIPSIENDRYWKSARQQILDVGATLAFWDPLSSYHSKNENWNSEMRRVMDRFTYLNRECNCSSLIVHHFGKPDPNNPVGLKYRMRGARAIQDWADTVMTISSPQGSDNSSRPRRRFDFVKVRNGPIHPPILVQRDECFVHCQIDEAQDEIDMIQKTVRSHGREIGSQNKMVERIGEALGLTKEPATRRLKNALQQGYITEKLIDGIKSYEVGA